MKVDTGWFIDLIRRSPYGSQRRFARKIRGRHGRPLDPSALSLLLRGKRAMQLEEARQFADVLDVPLIEVLRHAGIALPEEGVRTYDVIGTIDSHCELHLGKTKDTVTGPSDLPSDAIAVRCTMARSELALFDGWILFAEKPGPLSPSAIGRFALVSPHKGKPVCAFVSRGYKPGTVNLMSGFLSGPFRPHENTVLDWVAPVVWVRPQQ